MKRQRHSVALPMLSNRSLSEIQEKKLMLDDSSMVIDISTVPDVPEEDSKFSHTQKLVRNFFEQTPQSKLPTIKV